MNYILYVKNSPKYKFFSISNLINSGAREDRYSYILLKNCNIPAGQFNEVQGGHFRCRRARDSDRPVLAEGCVRRGPRGLGASVHERQQCQRPPESTPELQQFQQFLQRHIACQAHSGSQQERQTGQFAADTSLC